MNNGLYKLCLKIINNQNYKIMYILSNENKKDTYLAFAVSKEDPDQMISIKFDMDKFEIHNVPEWDFYIDEYLLNYLENDHCLEYMSLECHYDVWCSIDQWRDDIVNIEGLQKYLKYCQINDITPSLISKVVNNPVNIMDLYKERNYNYEIIASISIETNTIVLGFNKKKNEYVTWRTTVSRKGGYDLGHYFSDYRAAFDDYRDRCNTMLEKNLFAQKSKTRPKQKKEEVR